MIVLLRHIVWWYFESRNFVFRKQIEYTDVQSLSPRPSDPSRLQSSRVLVHPASTDNRLVLPVPEPTLRAPSTWVEGSGGGCRLVEVGGAYHFHLLVLSLVYLFTIVCGDTCSVETVGNRFRFSFRLLSLNGEITFLTFQCGVYRTYVPPHLLPSMSAVESTPSIVSMEPLQKIEECV